MSPTDSNNARGRALRHGEPLMDIPASSRRLHPCKRNPPAPGESAKASWASGSRALPARKDASTHPPGGMTIVTNTTDSFFQFLVAYIGIYSHGDPYSILNPWRPVWYLLCLIVLPPIAFITYGAPYFRFGASRLQKYTNHIRRALNDDFVEWATYTPPKHPFNNPESKLIDILLMEHLLLKIVGNMHHDDLVNLSSTCRSAREAIFPRHDLTMRIPKLMRLCCSKSIRERCYYCNKIICRVSFLPHHPHNSQVTCRLGL